MATSHFLQSEVTTLVVRDFDHVDVASMSNLKMTPKAVLHSPMHFEARKMWPYVMP
jgi:hypothetical protein